MTLKIIYSWCTLLLTCTLTQRRQPSFVLSSIMWSFKVCLVFLYLLPRSNILQHLNNVMIRNPGSKSFNFIQQQSFTCLHQKQRSPFLLSYHFVLCSLFLDFCLCHLLLPLVLYELFQYYHHLFPEIHHQIHFLLQIQL